jgi:sugar phosphate isomerase/epimerase
MTMNRRDFIKGAAALTAAGVSAAPAEVLKIGLNAYSFNKLLNDAIRQRGPGITLDGVLDFAAKNKFDAFDPTGYFFPGYPKAPADSYVESLKKHAADLGIALSGTGVRNNFTIADKEVRAAGVAHIKEWVEVAARLGVPVIRVFADTQMRAQTWQTVSNGASRADVLAWIAAALGECAEHGKKYKVRIGVQNHGDFLQTGAQHLELIKAVGSDWCGPIVDTGYYKTPDPYVDMAMVAPHALNWQVKQSVFGQDSEIQTDLIRLVRIVRKSGYAGYLPIETLSPRGKPYDPFAVAPAFHAQLRDAIAKTA